MPSRSMSDTERTGALNRGPSPSTNSSPSPIAQGMVRMSENRIAASSPNRRNGCSVTSHASSGVLHSARKLPARARIARYSGR